MASIKFLLVDIGLLAAGAVAALQHEQALPGAGGPCVPCPAMAGGPMQERVVLVIEGEAAPSLADLHRAITALQLEEGARVMIANRCGDCVFYITVD